MSKKIKELDKGKKYSLFMIFLIAIVGASLLIFTKAATGTASFYLSPASGSHDIATNFAVTVYASSTDNINTVGPQITYDSTKLDFVSIDTTGSAFPVAGPGTGASGGVVTLNYGIQGTTSTGTAQKVATVTFKAKVGTGSTTLSFSPNSLIYMGDAVNVWNGVTTGGTYTFTTPDTTPPSVSITSPSANATVLGTTAINATASDDSGTVAKVEFYINGVLKATDTVAPYTYSWDTTTLTDGTYPLTAKAYDAALTPNSATSAAVSVKVQNSKPNLVISSITLSPAAPKPGDVVTATATVTNNGSLALPAGTAVVTGFSVDSVAVSSPADSTALAIGASRTATYSWTATLGAHTITAMADKTNLVTEVNESDNTFSKNVTVQKSGDANGDGSINLADFSILNNNWGLPSRTLAQGDFNGDGLVNLADFSILNNNWGK